MLVDKREEKRPKKDPLERPDYIEAEIQAVRAVNAGAATPQQQQLAIKFLTEDVCGTYDMPFRPGSDGDRDTDFACGKMWVGQTLVWLLKNAPTKTSDDEISARRLEEHKP